MLQKTQIQFTRHQIEQHDELKRHTYAACTELVHLAVDCYFREVREHGVQKALLGLSTSDSREARLKKGRSLEAFS